MAELRPILLVEDNPKDLELTLAALEQCNLANGIAVARDGAEAIEFLTCTGAHMGRNTGEPAVVLLDLKLPRIDGLETLERIKSDPALRSTPVVMLTSSREERYLVRSYRSGVNAFVVKPVDFQEFFQAIRDLGMFWTVLNELPPNGQGPRGLE